ncbi:MAG TPA: response regulator [Pirellulales bacterium]|nr:response regulator [Pirellulales bacterium]
MLVLSRRAHQKIVFPTMQTTIEVIEVRGQTARLGITAPPDIQILREEIAPAANSPSPSDRPVAVPATEQTVRELRHLTRNQLHTWSIGLALLRGQWDQGMWDDLEITMDRLASELDATRERYEAVESKQTVEATAKPRKALLVEDNQNERELLAGFLRMSGFDVATAGDGADALDYLSAEATPDVVLLDMMMPRCDGPSTVHRIRSDPRWEGMKIFAVSGMPRHDVQLGTGAAGVDGWFSKPVDPRTLVRELSRELSGAPARPRAPTAATR